MGAHHPVEHAVFDQALALPHVGTQGCDLRRGAEAATEQAVGMQLPQPACIADISLPARHVLRVAETFGSTPTFQYFETPVVVQNRPTLG